MREVPTVVQKRLLAAAKPEVHPDTDVLSAFAERRLAGQERSHVLNHLAHCTDCREVVFLATTPAEVTDTPLPSAATVLRWPTLRWSVAAACLVIVGAAVLLRQDYASDRKQASSPAKLDDQKAVKSLPSVASQPSSDDGLVAAIAPPQEAATENKAPIRDKEYALDLSAPAKARQRVDALKTQAASPAQNVPRQVNDQYARLTSMPSPDQLSNSLLPPASPSISREMDGVLGGTRASGSMTSAKAEAARISGDPKMVLNTAPNMEYRAALEGPLNKKATAATLAISGDTVEAGRAGGVTAKPVVLWPRWDLTAEGTLQRSLDSGKTWKAAEGPVSDAKLEAVCSVGPHVWVGGTAATLFHSADAGQHWSPINPSTSGKVLTGDIVHIEFLTAQNGQLTTAAGETWNTSDGGQTWTVN